MSTLNPNENTAERGKQFMVFKRLAETFPDHWQQVGTCIAPDPGTAFRKIVLRPGEKLPADIHGEYRIFCMEESGHIAVELHLRDLDAPEPSEQVAP